MPIRFWHRTGASLNLGLSPVLVAHDLAILRQVSDPLLVMQGGRVVESGPSDRVYHAPEHPYTRALLPVG
jgi:peptide/nickel transport system ATP-binding protein